jgi:hypothetical protein
MDATRTARFFSMNQRFTIDGSDALENMLATLCAEAGAAIRTIIPERRLKALLLGGGYGRGEGGVLKAEAGDQPYNDLEFYILLAGSDIVNTQRYHHLVEELSRELTLKAGIEVEFKLLGLARLERSAVSMFYYDLISGHRLLHGDESWMSGCAHHRSAHRIPLHEATRLLFNRCSGLLYSQEKLWRPHFTLEDSDFVGRNLAKAKLALGDVILAMRREYHWSCRERHKRLRKIEAAAGLQNFTSVVPLHAQGVEFKLRPVRSTRSVDELRAELEFLKEVAARLWMVLEESRLGKTFGSTANYSFDPIAKCPETRPFKNRLINARRFGAMGLLDRSYPRERLLRSLPLLLWRPDFTISAKAISFLQGQLRTSASSYSELVRAYEALWKIYN